MDISNLINRLNNELDKLNKLKNSEFDTNSFFTSDTHFNDDHDEYINHLKNNIPNEQTANENNLNESSESSKYEEIQPNTEIKSLILVKPNYLLSAQTMFKKTIKFSLKSFLISISLSFLNLFV